MLPPLQTRVVLAAPPHLRAASVPAALESAGFSMGEGEGAIAYLDLSADLDADRTVDAAEAFVARHAPECVLLLLPGHDGVSGAWPTDRAAFLLAGFVRSAALAWAPRRVRVNALGFDRVPGTAATAADLAAAALMLLRAPSVTGQICRLTL